MQYQQAHSRKHALMHACDDFVGDIFMSRMSPPGEDVGLIENGCCQAVLGLVQCCGPHGGRSSQTRADSLRHDVMNPLGINLTHGVMFAFMNEFVPDGDA